MAGGATNFSVDLDTTAPGTPTFAVAAGAAYATAQVTTADFTTTDTPTTGYQVLIWGDVDDTYDADVQTTEGASAWKAYSTSIAIKLSATDGSKTVHAKIRDDVWNATTQLDDSITLDTTLPTPNITVGPDVPKVSKISGKRVVSFSWQSDSHLRRIQDQGCARDELAAGRWDDAPDHQRLDQHGRVGGRLCRDHEHRLDH